MNLIKPFLILELNLETAEAESDVLDKLGIPYLSVMGSYKGIQNREYLFPLTSSHGDETNDLIELSKQYNQESILIVDANGLGSLYYNATNTERVIGQWLEVSKETISNLAAWTRVSERYFVVA